MASLRYRHNRSQQLRQVKLTGEEFIRRFLQHVLPRGCAKVRYYGLWSPTCRKQLEQARTLLSMSTTSKQRNLTRGFSSTLAFVAARRLARQESLNR